jgi:hypothetical protein
VAFVGIFVGGVYAGNVQPIARIFALSGSSSTVPSQPASISTAFLNNATISIPASGNSVLLGNVSTAGYRTVTIYIYVAKTTCAPAGGGLNFNGYWKPDKSFPVAGSTAFANMIVNGGGPNAVVTSGPVPGGMLIFFIISTYSSACSANGVWLSLYLQS